MVKENSITGSVEFIKMFEDVLSSKYEFVKKPILSTVQNRLSGYYYNIKTKNVVIGMMVRPSRYVIIYLYDVVNNTSISPTIKFNLNDNKFKPYQFFKAINFLRDNFVEKRDVKERFNQILLSIKKLLKKGDL